jgi:NADPH:quinone reductase
VQARAGLLLAGSTAIHALSPVGVKEGETVLVHAAAGAVGSMIVQLARATGVRVIGAHRSPQPIDTAVLVVAP